MTPRLHLKSLGGLQLSGPGGNLLSGRRVDLSLLVVVASRSPSPVRREELQALFWGERTEDKARNSLRQVVFRLRQACGDSLEVDAASLRLRNGDVELDALRFSAAASFGGNNCRDAVDLWTGEFLPGCEDIGGDEFRTWLEVERERMRRMLAHCFEQALSGIEADQDWTAAVSYAAKWSDRFPLDEHAQQRYVAALCRTGHLAEAEAARHTFVRRLKHELDDDPSPEWFAATEQLVRAARDAEARALEIPRAEAPLVEAQLLDAPLVGGQENDAQQIAPARSTPNRRHRAYPLVAAAVVVFAAVLFGVRMATARSGRPPALAVGEITSTLPADSVRGFSTLLTINLARISDLDVITERRLSEVGAGRSADKADVIAKKAGAREILEGVLSRRPDNTFRADLRRINLASGATRTAYTLQGRDLTELADLVTERVARDLGVQSPVGRPEGTTTSILAYQFYEQGLRAYYDDDVAAARRFFAAALAEDSTFAMAAYYTSLVSTGDKIGEYRAQALRHAQRLGDRERLFINVAAGRPNADPRVVAWAETLVTRYPADPDGHVMYAQALLEQRQLSPALEHFRRVVEMDSANATTAAHCRACDALGGMTEIYVELDSFAVAERMARTWLRWQPHSPGAWWAYSAALGASGQFARAHAAVDSDMKYSPNSEPLWHAVWWFRADDYEAVDRTWRAAEASGRPGIELDALWTRVISSRTQGRLRDALEAAREYRTVANTRNDRLKPDVAELLLEASVLFDAGQPRKAAALFDSCARLSRGRMPVVSQRGATLAWYWTNAASGYAAAGDTAALRWVEDSVRVNGALGTERHQRLHNYVRGLRLAAEHRPAEAAAAYAQAISGPQDTYARIYLELGRSLTAANRPRDAVAPLVAGLRGPVTAAGLYATRTELEEVLALAYDRSGQRDLAIEQYQRVLHAWRNADPEFAARRAQAQSRVGALLQLRAAER